MHLPQIKSYLINLIISLLVVVIGIFVYDFYFNEPTIIFNDTISVRKVGDHKVVNYVDFDFVTVSKKSLPAVVSIRTIKKNKEGIYINTSGSGVCISPSGQIVTNYHVVSNSEKIVVTMYDNRTYDAKIIGKDISTDLAVIKINLRNHDFVFLGNSDNIEVGEWIMLIGNPFKLNNSITAGIVSAKNRELNILGSAGIESYIQTDAIANPGNSGGAMLNKNGELVGVLSAISTESGSFQGYSFAIPSNIVKKVAFDIINYGVVQRAWMGVSIKKADSGNGVILERVNYKEAAYEAGLIKNDIVVSIDNKKILGVASFNNIISQFKPGDIVTINYERGNEKKSTIVTLKNNLNTTDLIANRADEILTNLGFVLRELTSKEKVDYFGIYVESVIKGSKVGAINIEPGYIIQEINGKKINSVDTFISEYKNIESKVKLKGVYKMYPGIFPYVFEK